MKQETAFFDTQQVEALPSQISEYFLHIADGSGEKVSQLLMSLAMITSGFVIAFIRGPVFALICLCYFPFYLIIICLYGKKLGLQTMLKQKQNKELGSFTEEQMSAIKLVIAFGREEHALKEYEKIAEETRKIGTKVGM